MPTITHRLGIISAEDDPPAEFRPNAYREARSTRGRLQRALWQCPSPWAYAERVGLIAQREERISQWNRTSSPSAM